MSLLMDALRRAEEEKRRKAEAAAPAGDHPEHTELPDPDSLVPGLHDEPTVPISRLEAAELAGAASPGPPVDATLEEPSLTTPRVDSATELALEPVESGAFSDIDLDHSSTFDRRLNALSQGFDTTRDTPPQGELGARIPEPRRDAETGEVLARATVRPDLASSISRALGAERGGGARREPGSSLDEYFDTSTAFDTSGSFGPEANLEKPLKNAAQVNADTVFEAGRARRHGRGRRLGLIAAYAGIFGFVCAAILIYYLRVMSIETPDIPLPPVALEPALEIELPPPPQVNRPELVLRDAPPSPAAMAESMRRLLPDEPLSDGEADPALAAVPEPVALPAEAFDLDSAAGEAPAGGSVSEGGTAFEDTGEAVSVVPDPLPVPEAERAAAMRPRLVGSESVSVAQETARRPQLASQSEPAAASRPAPAPAPELSESASQPVSPVSAALASAAPSSSASPLTAASSTVTTDMPGASGATGTLPAPRSSAEPLPSDLAAEYAALKAQLPAAPAPRVGVSENPVVLKRRDRSTELNALLDTGYRALGARDLAAAERAYQQALAIVPELRDAELGLAAIAVARGDSRAAFERYSLVLRRHPGDPVALAGMFSLTDGQNPLADISTLKLLIDQTDNPAPLHFALGRQQARSGNWADAQQSFFKAYGSAPDNPDYCFNLAVALDRLGQPQAALTYYQKALDMAVAGQPSFDPSVARARIQRLGALP